MASGAPPDRLNNRHRIIAALEVAGWKDREIGERVGMHPNRISIVRQSPLYQALLATEREKFGQATADLYQRIVEKAPRAVERLGELMEQDDNPAVALGATKEFIDRALPKRQQADGFALKITLEQQQYLRSVLDEDCDDTVIDVTAVGPRDLSGVEPPDSDANG